LKDKTTLYLDWQGMQPMKVKSKKYGLNRCEKYVIRIVQYTARGSSIARGVLCGGRTYGPTLKH
jgi:hypothetical protein